MVTRLYGEQGASRTGLTMIGYDVDSRVAVIRTTLATLDLVKTTLAATTKIGNKPAAFRILSVSGTLRSLSRNQP